MPGVLKDMTSKLVETRAWVFRAEGRGGVTGKGTGSGARTGYTEGGGDRMREIKESMTSWAQGAFPYGCSC